LGKAEGIESPLELVRVALVGDMETQKENIVQDPWVRSIFLSGEVSSAGTSPVRSGPASPSYLPASHPQPPYTMLLPKLKL
jgi:hypothetical protein